MRSPAPQKLHTRSVPAITPELRASLERLQGEEFERGRAAGRIEGESRQAGAGIITFGMGSIFGAVALWLIQRVVA